MLIFIFIFIWLLIGYIAWRIEYYSSIKYWWIEFKEDWRTYVRPDGGENAMQFWVKIMPLIIIGGCLSLMIALLTPNKTGYCFYFKIPKREDK